jgi:dTMP kinase
MGKLVVFDGFDGSGKTTQLKLMAERLSKLGVQCITTRQPTDHYRNLPEVRQFLQEGGSASKAAELAEISALDRRAHFASFVMPHLQEGSVVLCDRYVFSSIAYFLRRGVDVATLQRLNKNQYRPDLAFFMSLSPRALKARLVHRDGTASLKKEEMSEGAIAAVVRNFLLMCPPMTIVDAERGATYIHNELFLSVSALIKE